jgi:PhzF family phenazine biosynthesis protein
MASIPFALYDAFSETAFGGSQAGVISDASKLDKTTRQQIAQEIAAPATAFVIACNEKAISAKFHSPLTEYSMCGHGTICLMTRMIEQGVLRWNDNESIDVDLHLADSIAPVQLFRREDTRPEVLLDIIPPKLSRPAIDQQQLASLLGLHTQDIADDWPINKAVGDFVHLIVPLRNLKAMARIAPDFSGLINFCKQHSLQTIAVFCTEVNRADSDVHMRDFCPAVGVDESAGAGTTNAALATYLIHHGIFRIVDGSGQIIVRAEQGIELRRPSSIRSVVTMKDGAIERLQVGGVATKIIDGNLTLPN